MVAQDLVHAEHVHLVLPEDGSHRVVAPYLPLVVRRLQISLFHVSPYLADGLGPRQLKHRGKSAL